MPAVKKWSDETVAQLVDGYRKEDSDASVAELMEALGKSKREVVGKLASMKVYVAPEKPTRKTPVDTRPTKKELVKQLEDAGFTEFTEFTN